MIDLEADGALAISVRGVNVSFGETTVLDDVTFEVAPGTITGLVGPNGAGKSTLTQVILGLRRPDSGSATVFGRSLPDHPDPMRLLGVVTDAVNADPAITPRAFLRYLCAWAGLPYKRVDAVLASTAAEGYRDKRIGSLSTGMRQRVMLASALLGEPRCLVLDEPHNGLDPDGMRWLRGFMRQFSEAGGAILVASHLLAEINQSADHIVMLNRSVRFAGPLADITSTEALEDMFQSLVSEGAL
ncbi:ABC transporter ATP-binding protein [Frankia sp. AgB32]|uniref:ABC transporter ATP-binding protein n=1 Tax=Frankia sp. AgB32 TaxID=631119 RepID=UPI00200D3128|nr:ATP-binding cassette domain-containing protein [Frankia sp. AgB32]MCK9896273.1 ATP-binding cassette domain-containing protein [Frankia sp. AgB32]